MRRLIDVAKATLITLAVATGPLACATYTGQEVTVASVDVADAPGWIRVARVPLVRQRSDWDCGIAALSMILRYWAIKSDPELVARALRPAMEAKRPVRAGELRAIARAHGADAFLFRGTFDDLTTQLAKGRPVLVGEVKPTVGGSVSHFAVVVGVNPELRRVLLLDPAHGVRENSYTGFDDEWARAGRLTLLVLGSTTAVAGR